MAITLNDYIAKLPLDTSSKIRIFDNRVIFPTPIDPVKFYKDFKSSINSNTLTTEKALYAASKKELSVYKTSTQLLNRHLKFV